MMFGSAKPMASLSPGLLARKGQARPAMRRQVAAGHAGDDLGWNDMGEPAVAPATPAPTPALTPMHAPAPVPTITQAPAPVPPVLVEREALQETLAAGAEPAPVSAPVGVEAKAERPIVPGRRAAFTLRLDAERHLRLRLASATQGRSAQHLVTQALDAFLATMPEVEALARRMSGPNDLSGDGS